MSKKLKKKKVTSSAVAYDPLPSPPTFAVSRTIRFDACYLWYDPVYRITYQVSVKITQTLRKFPSFLQKQRGGNTEINGGRE